MDGSRRDLPGREATFAISSEMFGNIMVLFTMAATASGNNWELAQRSMSWRQLKQPPGFTCKLVE